MDRFDHNVEGYETSCDVQEVMWEFHIANFLSQLTAVQTECLDLLRKKQAALAARDLSALTSLQNAAGALIQRLESCLQQRGDLLAEANKRGYSARSLRELVEELPKEALPQDRKRALEECLRAASWEWRLLQHQALANWLLLQRSILHLSQLLEIIATGGQGLPTYTMGSKTAHHHGTHSGGNLVDQRA